MYQNDVAIWGLVNIAARKKYRCPGQGSKKAIPQTADWWLGGCHIAGMPAQKGPIRFAWWATFGRMKETSFVAKLEEAWANHDRNFVCWRCVWPFADSFDGVESML